MGLRKFRRNTIQSLRRTQTLGRLESRDTGASAPARSASGVYASGCGDVLAERERRPLETQWQKSGDNNYPALLLYAVITVPTRLVANSHYTVPRSVILGTRGFGARGCGGYLPSLSDCRAARVLHTFSAPFQLVTQMKLFILAALLSGVLSLCWFFLFFLLFIYCRSC